MMPILQPFIVFGKYIAASKWRQLGLLMLLQGLLMLIGFNKIMSNPEEMVFMDDWDGVKNYYTYVWYVAQPDTVPYKLFTGMNYPYNEFIYYTDNTPILAVTVRWVHLNLVDLSGHFTAIYHWAMFLSVWLSTLLLFFILRKLGLPVLWVMLASLCLVWLHPQMHKFSGGCYNMAFSWTLLGLFYGMLHLHQYLMLRNARKTVLWSLILALVVIVSAFSHLYYIPLLLLWMAFYLGVMSVYQLFQRKLPWLPVVSGLLVAGISVGICLGLILLTDDYYDYRLTFNAGYGYREWILNYKDIFAPYYFNRVQYIFNIQFSETVEGHSYLGSAALYGITVLLAIGVWKQYQSRQWPKFFPLSSDGLFWLAIGIGAVAMTFVALSDYIETSKDHYIRNYLNLFLYLGMLTEAITQFRGLGRFVWPLFWFVNFMFLWYLAKRRAALPGILVVIVFILMVSDTLDMLRHYNHIYKLNPFAEKQLQQIRQTYNTVDAQRYQALLPLPYYHVGSDNYDITMDTERIWARESMQLSMAWDMPLIAAQLARTAEYQAINLTAMFQTKTMDAELIGLMDERPVLVVITKRLMNPCGDGTGVPETWAIDVCALTLIQENDQYQLYEWWPHSN